MTLKHSLVSTVFRSIDSLTIEGTASNGILDRAGDILVPAGMQKVGSRGVPVLAQHDPTMPIGRANLWLSGDRIASRITFAPEGASLKADEYRKLSKAGVIDTLSVGFIPHKWEPLKGGGLRYTAWECIELSLVAVPCNPDAVVTARANRADKADDDFAKTMAMRLNEIAKRYGRPPFASPAGRILSDLERRTARIAEIRQQQTDLLLDQSRYRHLSTDKFAERLRYIRGRSS